MGGPRSIGPVPGWVERHSSVLAATGIVAAALGFAVPGPTGATAGIAAVLALAALAALAGHASALIAVAVADVILAGQLAAAARHEPEALARTLAALGLAAALPGALVFLAAGPRFAAWLASRHELAGSRVPGVLTPALALGLIAGPLLDGGALDLDGARLRASAERAGEPAAPGPAELGERSAKPTGRTFDDELAAAGLADHHDRDAGGHEPPLHRSGVLLSEADHEAGGCLAEPELVRTDAGWRFEDDARPERLGADDAALGECDDQAAVADVVSGA
jgi:hypothetical protein